MCPLLASSWQWLSLKRSIVPSSAYPASIISPICSSAILSDNSIADMSGRYNSDIVSKSSLDAFVSLLVPYYWNIIPPFTAAVGFDIGYPVESPKLLPVSLTVEFE